MLKLELLCIKRHIKRRDKQPTEWVKICIMCKMCYIECINKNFNLLSKNMTL